MIQMDLARQHFAIPELANDFENLRPGGIQALVHLLVHLDRLDEFELLDVHFSLFSLAPIIGAPATRPAATLKSSSAAPIVAAAAVYAFVIRFFQRHLPALEAGSAIDVALAAIFPGSELALVRRRRLIGRDF